MKARRMPISMKLLSNGYRMVIYKIQLDEGLTYGFVDYGFLDSKDILRTNIEAEVANGQVNFYFISAGGIKCYVEDFKKI